MKKTEATKEMIERTIHFLEKSGSCVVVKRYFIKLKFQCGNCLLLHRVNKPLEQYEYLQVEFERVRVKRGDGKFFEAYECPECGYLADAKLTDMAIRANSIDFIY